MTGTDQSARLMRLRVTLPPGSNSDGNTDRDNVFAHLPQGWRVIVESLSTGELLPVVGPCELVIKPDSLITLRCELIVTGITVNHDQSTTTGD